MEGPEFLIGGYHASGAGQISSEKPKTVEQFTVDEYLLDFSNEDVAITSGYFDNIASNSSDSSTVAAVDSCNSSISGGDYHFSGNKNINSSSFSEAQFAGDQLNVPCDDLAELEWLSNFVEDSFSIQDKDLQLHDLPFFSGASSTHTLETSSSSVSGTTAFASHHSSHSDKTGVVIQNDALPLDGKARSKRSRASPCDLSTRILHVAAPADKKMPKTVACKKTEGSNSELPGRKCFHCAAEKTPQWRTGPMGPKTLCNACGVRYKSGRLVPEYRPASSPSFVSSKHSNSHRKVVELRRQKEIQRAQQHQFLSQSSIFSALNGCDDYLIHHFNGHDYNKVI